MLRIWLLRSFFILLLFKLLFKPFDVLESTRWDEKKNASSPSTFHLSTLTCLASIFFPRIRRKRSTRELRRRIVSSQRRDLMTKLLASYQKTPLITEHPFPRTDWPRGRERSVRETVNASYMYRGARKNGKYFIPGKLASLHLLAFT